MWVCVVVVLSWWGGVVTSGCWTFFFFFCALWCRCNVCLIPRWRHAFNLLLPCCLLSGTFSSWLPEKCSCFISIIDTLLLWKAWLKIYPADVEILCSRELGNGIFLHKVTTPPPPPSAVHKLRPARQRWLPLLIKSHPFYRYPRFHQTLRRYSEIAGVWVQGEEETKWNLIEQPGQTSGLEQHCDECQMWFIGAKTLITHPPLKPFWTTRSLRTPHSLQYPKYSCVAFVTL